MKQVELRLIKKIWKIKSYGRWCLSSDGYVTTKRDGKTLLMHRIVMDADDTLDVDHRKVGIKYKSDNRKSNLRCCTRSQNCFNSKNHKNNTSGYRGVSYRKDNNRWAAAITVNKKRMHLGLFDNPKDASKAYEKAAKEYHGEFYNSGE